MIEKSHNPTLGLHTITLTCDVRKGKGVCGTVASITMQNEDSINQFLFQLGWRLLRNHQVCWVCSNKPIKDIHFPRAIPVAK